MNSWQRLLAYPRFRAACLIAAWMAAAVCLALAWGTVTRQVGWLLRGHELRLMYLFASCTAATICLIALWAGSSRGHWFPRTIVPCLALAAFIPIGAHELLIFFSLVMVEITSILLAWRVWQDRRLRRAAGNSARAAARHPLSFGLGDALLAVVIVALAVWTIKDFAQVALMIRWGVTINTSLLVTLLALLGWRAAHGPSRLIWLGLCIVMVTATAYINGWKLTDCLYASHLFSLGHSGTTSYADFQLAWVAAALFAGWIMALSLATQSAFSPDASSWHRRLGRATLFLSLLVYVPLGWLYWTLTSAAQMPPSPQMTGNIYPQVVALSIESQSVSPAEAQAIYTRLAKLLDQPGYVPLDRAVVISDPSLFRRFADERQIIAASRWFESRAEALQRRGRHDEAAADAMSSLKLARLQWRGGLAVDVRVAAALEAEGIRELARHRGELSPDTMRQAIRLLESIDDAREPIDVVVQRTDACERLAQRWRITLERRIFWDGLFGTAGQRHPERSSVEESVKNSQSLLRLLQADLAIRLFRRDHAQYPQSLQEVVPEYLQVAPTDPYSNRMLVYRPQEDGFILYAVGSDGHDNGGKTPTGWRGIREPETDWDLDWHVSQ